MNKTNTNMSVLQRSACWLILTGQILRIYAIGPISFMEFFLTIFFLLFLIKGRHPFRSTPTLLLIYMGYAYLIQVLSFNSIYSIIPIGFLLNVIGVLFFYGCVRFKYLLSVYVIIASFSIFFFFLQTFSYYVAGVHINGVLEFLPLALNVDSSWLLDHKMADRFSSFFSEPAHFAQFLLPLLCYSIFSEKESSRKRIALSVIIVVVLMLLKSGNGYLGLIAVFVSYGFYIFIVKSIDLKKIVLVLLALPLIFYLGSTYMRTETGMELLERSNTIGANSENAYKGSGYMRTWRGWLLFIDLPLEKQVFGVGDNQNLVSSISSSSIWTDFIDEDDTYLNGIQAIFVNTGYVGAILFALFIISLWKGNSFEGKTQLVVLLVLSLISANFLSETMVLSLLMSHFSRPKQDIKHEIGSCSYC